MDRWATSEEDLPRNTPNTRKGKCVNHRIHPAITRNRDTRSSMNSLRAPSSSVCSVCSVVGFRIALLQKPDSTVSTEDLVRCSVYVNYYKEDITMPDIATAQRG